MVLPGALLFLSCHLLAALAKQTSENSTVETTISPHSSTNYSMRSAKPVEKQHQNPVTLNPEVAVSSENDTTTTMPAPLPVCSFDSPVPFVISSINSSIRQSATNMATIIAGPRQLDFVATWQSVLDGSGSGIFASIFRAFDNNSVVTLLPPFQVNRVSLFDQRSPQVATLQDGGFVITFESTVPLDETNQSQRFQRVLIALFDRQGQPLGAEFQVEDTSTKFQDSIPRIAALKQSISGYVVSWVRYPVGGSAQSSGILHFRIFNNDGSPRTDPIAVNTALGDQVLASHQVAGLDSGDFVMSWTSLASTGNCQSQNIAGQLFNNVGLRVGSQFQINPYSAFPQSEPFVQSLTGGDLSFVISWTSGLDGGYSLVMFQLFDKNYARFGPAQPAYQTSAPIQSGSVVANRNDGGFLIVWNDYNPATGNFGIFGQLYDDRGVPLAMSPFQAGDSSGGVSQILPDALVSPINQVFLSWTTSDNSLLGQAISCSFDCVVSDWTEWSQCSARCGGGQRGRIRNIITPAIQGGEPCPTDLIETETCNEQPCPDPKCAYCQSGSCFMHIPGQFTYSQAAQQCQDAFCPDQVNCISNVDSRGERAFIANNFGDGSDAWIASWQGNNYGGCLTMSSYGAIIIPQAGCEGTYQSVICEIPTPATCS